MLQKSATIPTQAIGLQLGALVTLARNDAREAALLAGAYAAIRDTEDPFLSPTETLGLLNPEGAARAVLDEGNVRASLCGGPAPVP